MTDLAHVRGDRQRPRTSVDSAKIERLLAETGSDQTARVRRDFAILSVRFGTGLRRSELVGLDLSHVEGNRLMVFGNGNQLRPAYLGLESATTLEVWLAVRGKAPRALFVRIHRSGQVRPARLPTEAVARIVGRRAASAGVGEH